MGFKIANTEVINDSGNFVGDFGGLVVNCQLVFQDLRSSPEQGGGTISGYNAGGTRGFPSSTRTDGIEKFPFSSDTSASDVGELTQGRVVVAGQSSTISGYTSGGSAPPNVDIVDKFPFSEDSPALDVGDLTQARGTTSGQSSCVSGYTSGSYVIDKFPFAADVDATNVGNLTQTRSGTTGQSSSTSGYTSGGRLPGPPSGGPNADTIDKFPFSSDTNATDVGELSTARREAAGQSSTVCGYTSGGVTPTRNIIDKFPFTSDTSAVDIGDLSQGRTEVAGQSSTVSGYTSGGFAGPPPSAKQSTIDKFPFSSDTNATDVGELVQSRDSAAGQQS